MATGPRTAREKALATAERLFRLQGYAATGLTQIIRESGSPKGSFYFHFPGGKDQLATEVIQSYGARGLATIEQLASISGGNPMSFITALCRAFALEMRKSDYTLGCAVQNLVAERIPADTPLDLALAETLTGWISAMSGHFHKCGIDHNDASRLAQGLLAGLQGARTIARTLRREDPFRHVEQLTSRALGCSPNVKQDSPTHPLDLEASMGQKIVLVRDD
jgi:TetR/AcrR family transcriptional regulator, lmrAB and yxaGH operons repressor